MSYATQLLLVSEGVCIDCKQPQVPERRGKCLCVPCTKRRGEAAKVRKLSRTVSSLKQALISGRYFRPVDGEALYHGVVEDSGCSDCKAWTGLFFIHGSPSKPWLTPLSLADLTADYVLGEVIE